MQQILLKYCVPEAYEVEKIRVILKTLWNVPDGQQNTYRDDLNVYVPALLPRSDILHSILCSKGVFANSPFFGLKYVTTKRKVMRDLFETPKLWRKIRGYLTQSEL